MEYQIVFVFNFLLLVLAMKCVSWQVNPLHGNQNFPEFLFTSPHLSVRSKYHPPHKQNLLRKFLFNISGIALVVFIIRSHPEPFSFWDTLLISPTILLMTDAIGTFGQFMVWLKGKSIHAIHNGPFHSKTLSEFWGKRWNLWVQDWLRDVSKMNRRAPLWKRLTITFFFSGLFHEIMFNLPCWIFFRKNYFGTMVLYFMIQALGILIDKKFICKFSPIVQRIYLWVLVLVPSPLFINFPILTFLGAKA